MNNPDDDAARDLAAAAAGDHEAFGRVYDRHAPVVLALCRARAASPAEADDAMQETFIRAYSMLTCLDGSSPDATGLRSWLYAIARNVCAERRRSDRRRQHHEEAVMKLAAVLEHSSMNHPREAISGAEDLDRLTIALDQLDDDERLAIHLHYLDADPTVAARDALGVSRSAYYKLLAKARAKLARFMGEKLTHPRIKALRNFKP